MTSLTFPKAFKDEVLGKEPLNTSQMRQPTPHISEDLRQHKNKQNYRAFSFTIKA